MQSMKFFPMLHIVFVVSHEAEFEKYMNEKVTNIFQHASRVYRPANFYAQMEKLKKIHKPKYYYLIEADVHKRSCAYSPMRRYSMMTSNIAESMNSGLRQARKLLVMTLVKFIRSLMQTWFYDRRNVAYRTNTMLTSATSLHVTKNLDTAQYLIVRPVNHVTYQVNDGLKDYIVNLNDRTCTCRRFQIDLLPCSHACVALGTYCST